MTDHFLIPPHHHHPPTLIHVIGVIIIVVLICKSPSSVSHCPIINPRLGNAPLRGIQRLASNDVKLARYQLKMQRKRLKHNLAAGCSWIASTSKYKTAASQNLAMMMRPDKVGPTGPTCLNSFYWEVAPTERWLPNAKNVAKTSAKSLF